MKKILFILAMIASINVCGFSQETNVYTFFVNVVNENYKFPLFGFVNIAKGNHDNIQLGFINWNTGNFSTLQAGFINTAGGNLSGAQIGFINTSIGVVNGAQIGFINYADSIEDGIPIGFLSIVRRGGYKAVEYSFSEYYPINIGLKLGVERFYTAISVAYNQVEKGIGENFALGFGFGSIIPINTLFYINPEITSLNRIGNNGHILSLVPYFGFNSNKNISIALGPSLTWAYDFDGNEVQKPFFNIASRNINENNDIVLGARASIRFRF